MLDLLTYFSSLFSAFLFALPNSNGTPREKFEVIVGMITTPVSVHNLRPVWKYIATVESNEEEICALLKPENGSMARRDLIILKITHALPDNIIFCRC